MTLESSCLTTGRGLLRDDGSGEPGLGAETCAEEEMSSPRFDVGYAQVTVTPPLEVPYLSHIPRHALFAQVNDDLFARAVAIRSGTDTVLVISVDLLGLGRGVLDDDPLASTVRRQIADASGIPVEAILVCATHAHSTPETSGISTLPASAGRWVEQLVARLVAVGVAAVADCVPCDIHVGRAIVDDVSMIRRTHPVAGSGGLSGRVPTGAPDRSVTVLTARTRSDARTLLVNFACHPVLLQAQPTVSADYPGAVVADLAADGTRAIFLQGACGDVNPARGDNGTFEDVVRDARVIAAAARRAAERALGRDRQPGGVAAVTEMLKVSKRPLPTHLEWAVAHVEDPDPLWRRQAVDAVDLAARLGDPALPFSAEVQAIRVGEIAIIALPGEPFTELGLLIKAMSPAAHTIIVGYANDYLGYLAPRWAWLEGGYEVEEGPWSLVSGAGAEAIAESAIRLLDQLWCPSPTARIQDTSGEKNRRTRIGDKS